MEKLRAIACALFGHSRIHKYFFGYHHCIRCGALLGDSLAGAYNDKLAVYLHEGCERCQENVKTLRWRDRVLVPLKAKARLQELRGDHG